MIFLYSAVAALAAVAAEVFFKSNPSSSYLQLAWFGVPCAILVNVGIWGILHSGESVLGLTVMFGLFTAGLRIAWTLAYGGNIRPAVWVAFSLVVAASILKAVWK